MQHGRTQFLQHEERKQRKKQQSDNRLPGIDDGISVKSLIDVNQEIMAQRKQHTCPLQERMHGHDGICEARYGE